MQLFEIKKHISAKLIKIISFDLFDTLLFRPTFFPQDIFYLLSKRVHELYLINDFYNIRCTAERRLRESFTISGKHEINIYDIYLYISSYHSIDYEICNVICEEEIAIEKQLLQVRQDVKSIYDFAIESGKKIIIISDMYLPMNVIRDIINEKGLTKISNIYISSDFNKRKDTGDLYLEVVEQEHVKSHEIIHFGDNAISDVEIPRKLGIEAIHVKSLFDKIFDEKNIFSKIWKDLALIDIPSRFMLGLAMFSWFSEKELIEGGNLVFMNNLRFLGYFGLAPILLDIAIKISINSEIQSNYPIIYFASRDGYLPQKAYDIISRIFGGKPSSYLYCSRRAYFTSKFNGDILSFLFDNSRDGYFSVRRLMESIFYDLDLPLCKLLISQFTLEELESDYRVNIEKIENVISRYTNELSHYLYDQKNNAIQYYKKNIIVNQSNRSVVFDIGYSGSVSNSIGKLTGYKIDKIYTREEFTNRKRDEENDTKTWLLLDKTELIVSEFPYLFLIFEELFSSQEAACVGFIKNSDESCFPIISNDECYETIMWESLQAINEACLRYVELAAKVFKKYLKDLTINNHLCLIQPLVFAFNKSNVFEALMLENIKFPDTFYFTFNLSLSSKLLISRILSGNSHLNSTILELSRTQEELSRTQEELSRTQEELSRTQEELSGTQEELNKMVSSLSYRLIRKLFPPYSRRRKIVIKIMKIIRIYN
jgi:FMN phosphatase YigB (HAD superfamily)